MKKKRKKTRFDYDVFISYSSHDKTWMRGELLKRIEEAGLHAFINSSQEPLTR